MAVSEKAKKAAAARLAKLDALAAEDAKKKKNALRAKATMGSRKVRKKAATELSSTKRGAY